MDRCFEPDSPRALLEQASKLGPESIDWLWTDWLAKGKLHLLAGPPGQGKTTIALSFAATASAGSAWPDGSPCGPGTVLIWSGEDDTRQTLLPRLIAMGANTDRVHFVTGRTSPEGRVEPFDPACDLDLLAAEVARLGDVSLMVVDPVVSAVTGDSNHNAEVRRSLQPLVDLAMAHRVAVVGITHFTKSSSGRDPVERVTGSIAFAAVARVVLCAVRSRVNVEASCMDCLLVRAKSNLSSPGGGIAYRIEERSLDSDDQILAVGVAWGQTVMGSAAQLLSRAEADPRDEADQKSLEHCLLTLLEHGQPVHAKHVKEVTQEKGAWPWRTVHRAANRLGVDVYKERGKLGGRWMWRLRAPIRAEGAEGARL